QRTTRVREIIIHLLTIHNRTAKVHLWCEFYTFVSRRGFRHIPDDKINNTYLAFVVRYEADKNGERSSAGARLII
ncbi:MAG: hypothetical protein ACYTBX_10075, partial [Planctomycetota bacterium]